MGESRAGHPAARGEELSELDTEPIVTRRLDLLPLREAHAEEMAGVLADPALYTHIGGVPPTAATRLPRARLRSQSYWLGCRGSIAPTDAVQRRLRCGVGGTVDDEALVLVLQRGQHFEFDGEGSGFRVE